jgi:suppressor of ftsI
VVIRMRFTQFTGAFVYHCHILAHEDNGMMGLIEVSRPDAGHGGHGMHMHR